MSNLLRRGFLLPLSLIFSLLIVFSCGSGDGSSMKSNIKQQQYVNEGRDLYAIYCANCHGPNGKGLAELFPPVAQSDYLVADINRAICIAKNGLEGEVVVNGTNYDLAMPANEKLTNLEVAEILTFILNEMNSVDTLLLVSDVEDVLRNCED